MKKVEANAAKINEPDHRLIWWPKVRGKWPRHRSVDHLIHAHVSLSLSSVLHASAFLHSKSTLHSSTYSFASSKWLASVVSLRPCLNQCRTPFLLPFPLPSAAPTTLGWECVCGLGHVPTHDDAWCVRDAFAVHRVPKRPHSDAPHLRNFNSTFGVIESVDSASISARNYRETK